MSALKIGSLFSGYGGLDAGVSSVLDAETAWVSDIDKGACKILAHRFPNVPNLGDLTAVDWSTVEPVDIITGGFPCQDLSHAGKRAGMADGTRSGLWSYMCEAINIIRPRLVVAENVRGLLSAEALRPVESCTWCVGDDADLDLRALGAVLADLADIGYDASWYGLRAADVGACHGRFRVFLVAWKRGQVDAQTRPDGARQRDDHALPSLPTGDEYDPFESDGACDEQPRLRAGVAAAGRLTLLPTPTTQDAANNGGPSQFERNTRPLNTEVLLLPTPAVNDMGKAYTPDEWDAWTDKMKAAHGNGNGHGKSLEIEAARLLPTPSVADVQGGRKGRSGDRSDELLLNGLAHEQRFGQYAAAIQRWESATGMPAPAPTEPTGKGGAHRLSPKFTEWMMGLPSGWITDAPGITRNEALKACGNGVVPQQAAAALRILLNVTGQEVAA